MTTSIISVDSFMLLEKMMQHAKKGPTKKQAFYPSTIHKAVDEAGLKNNPRDRSAYTHDLKTAGVIEQQGKQGWVINLAALEETMVADLDTTVDQLIIRKGEKVVDLTTPETPPEPVVEPTQTVEWSEQPAGMSMAEAVEQVSGTDLANSIARELFDRLTSAERRVREAWDRAMDEAGNVYRPQIEDLKQQLIASDTARRLAEEEAVVFKTKAEKFEYQYAQLMKEIASAKDGEGIKEAALRFFRPNANDSGSVPVSSQ